MKLKLLSLSLLAASILSCKDSDPKASAFVDLSSYIWVKDVSGRNLLNKATPGYLDSSKIRIFYDIEGKETEYYSPNLDAPYGFQVQKYEPNGEYYLWVVASPYQPSVTYIKWPSGDEDTLSCSLIRSKHIFVVDEVYWNGIEKFKNKDPNRQENWGTKAFGRFFEVIK